MVEIGGRPILWHIMKIYAAAGYTDSVICLGYKGDVIREYFLNYEVRNRDFTITLGCGRVDIHDGHAESGWRITLAETGDNTLTGGRIKGVGNYLKRRSLNPSRPRAGGANATPSLREVPPRTPH